MNKELAQEISNWEDCVRETFRRNSIKGNVFYCIWGIQVKFERSRLDGALCVTGRCSNTCSCCEINKEYCP